MSGGHAGVADMDIYTFTASSNDVVSFALVRTNGTGGTDLYLYDPQGNQVASSLGDGLRVYYPELHLTESGTYIFAVLSSGLTGTYDYTLCTVKFPGPNFPEPGEGAELILSGETRAAQITPGDLDAYTFPVIAGDDVVVTVSKTSGAGAPVLYLYGPDGVVLASDSRTAGGQVRIQCSQQHGPFFIVCLASGLNQAFTYSLRLVQAPSPPPSRTRRKARRSGASAGSAARRGMRASAPTHRRG